MKQFSLTEYLKNPSKKIVTRDGRSVKRILCVDAKGDYPIVALIKSKDEKEEYPFRYTVNGQFSPGYEKQADLFFVPEKYEGWVNIYTDCNNTDCLGTRIFKSKDEAEKEGKKWEDYVITIKIEWEK